MADTYDVITARDTYRDPVSSYEAVIELRRVSGTQLDPRFVEAFIEVLDGKDLAYRHGEDAGLRGRTGARQAHPRLRRRKLTAAIAARSRPSANRRPDNANATHDRCRDVRARAVLRFKNLPIPELASAITHELPPSANLEIPL